ncbi:hypothetical protein LINPERPRIM_LOCUS11045, partial [Linum perenne]
STLTIHNSKHHHYHKSFNINPHLSTSTQFSSQITPTQSTIHHPLAHKLNQHNTHTQTSMDTLFI